MIKVIMKINGMVIVRFVILPLLNSLICVMTLNIFFILLFLRGRAVFQYIPRAADFLADYRGSGSKSRSWNEMGFSQ